jgi:hypothetical protein
LRGVAVLLVVAGFVVGVALALGEAKALAFLLDRAASSVATLVVAVGLLELELQPLDGPLGTAVIVS